MSRRPLHWIATPLVILLVLVASAHRGAGEESDRCCGPCGRDVCVPRVEEVTVEKHCWKVEHKKTCVPAVRFPWEEGGCGLTCFDWLTGGHGCCTKCGRCPACRPSPSCGKVICVRDLKKETYECTEYECQWEVRRLPPCCCNGAGCGCCDVCRDGPHSLRYPQ